MFTDQSDHLRITSAGVIETCVGEHIMNAFPETTPMPASSVLNYHINEACRINPSYEVLMLRVFHFNDNWHIATRRKLDAFDSYWANSTSIGEQFESVVESILGAGPESLDAFLQSLDTQKRYFFLIPLTGQQKIKKEGCTDVFWLAGTEQEGRLDFEVEKEPKNAWSYLPRLKFDSSEEMKTWIYKQYKTTNITGVMLIYPGHHLRVMHPEYYRLFHLRDNSPNLPEQFLTLMKREFKGEITKADLNMFKKHFELKDFAHIFLCKIAMIHDIYMRRYIHKEYVHTTALLHSVLCKCHKQYLQTHARVTKNTVLEILLKNYDARALVKIATEH